MSALTLLLVTFQVPVPVLRFAVQRENPGAAILINLDLEWFFSLQEAVVSLTSPAAESVPKFPLLPECLKKLQKKRNSACVLRCAFRLPFVISVPLVWRTSQEAGNLILKCSRGAPREFDEVPFSVFFLRAFSFFGVFHPSATRRKGVERARAAILR